MAPLIMPAGSRSGQGRVWSTAGILASLKSWQLSLGLWTRHCCAWRCNCKLQFDWQLLYVTVPAF